MNDREKIVKENINLCLENRDILTEWEIGFVTSINDYEHKGSITQNQFNVLHRIVSKIKQERTA